MLSYNDGVTGNLEIGIHKIVYIIALLSLEVAAFKSIRGHTFILPPNLKTLKNNNIAKYQRIKTRRIPQP